MISPDTCAFHIAIVERKIFASTKVSFLYYLLKHLFFLNEVVSVYFKEMKWILAVNGFAFSSFVWSPKDSSLLKLLFSVF